MWSHDYSKGNIYPGSQSHLRVSVGDGSELINLVTGRKKYLENPRGEPDYRPSFLGMDSKVSVYLDFGGSKIWAVEFDTNRIIWENDFNAEKTSNKNISCCLDGNLLFVYAGGYKVDSSLSMLYVHSGEEAMPTIENLSYSNIRSVNGRLVLFDNHSSEGYVFDLLEKRQVFRTQSYIYAILPGNISFIHEGDDDNNSSRVSVLNPDNGQYRLAAELSDVDWRCLHANEISPDMSLLVTRQGVAKRYDVPYNDLLSEIGIDM